VTQTAIVHISAVQMMIRDMTPNSPIIWLLENDHATDELRAGRTNAEVFAK
jgi:hypothetical protein